MHLSPWSHLQFISPLAFGCPICGDTRFSATVLFGSAAAGRTRPQSDVDVAVLYAGDEARRQVDEAEQRRGHQPADHSDRHAGAEVGVFGELTRENLDRHLPLERGRLMAANGKAALVTGACPIGLLAAFLLSLHELEVHVLDRAESGPKPELVRALGAMYHTGSVLDLPFEPDIIVECTGAGPVIADSIHQVGEGGILCLAGVGSGGIATRAVGDVAAGAVLKNNVIVGSVNANKRHWYKASKALARADRKWLSRLITRREKPEHFNQALERKPDDIKVVIQFSDI